MYWRLLIIINHILLRMGVEEQNLVFESRAAAENICKSVEYGLQWKPIGSVFVLFNLPVAYSFCDSGRLEWMMDVVNEVAEPLEGCPKDILAQYLDAIGMGDVKHRLGLSHRDCSPSEAELIDGEVSCKLGERIQQA